MNSKVLVPIADGFEEIEAMNIVDILRRAGADVTLASVQGTQVKGAHGILLTADQKISDCLENSYDLIALPGGSQGAENLRDSKEVVELLKKQKDFGKYYAAICASPAVVFAHHGLLEGVQATCYPSCAPMMPKGSFVDNPVVVDGTCITSQGPATATLFALKLVEVLLGKDKAGSIASDLLL